TINKLKLPENDNLEAVKEVQKSKNKRQESKIVSKARRRDYQGQKMEDKIIIETLIEKIIKDQVEEGEVQEKLLTAAQKLQNIEKIDFYTDKSLYEEKETPQKIKIGAE
ncbi:13184_t:CDS:2, partial [Ambispora leptoticha]